MNYRRMIFREVKNYFNPSKISPAEKGVIGESFLHKYISHMVLPGHYCTVSNILLPIGKVKTQIDTVLIHEKGIFCIEYKNYSGWIYGSEDQKYWTKRLKTAGVYGFYNPVMQNRTHCIALAKVLRTVPENIESLIVFGDKCRLAKVDCPKVPVIQLHEFNMYMAKYFFIHENRFTEKNVDAVYELLKLYIPTEEEMKDHIERVKKL